MDTRLELLKDWVAATLGRSDYDIKPAFADASFRRYFRVTADDTSYIVMDAPPDKEDSGPYVRIAERFFELGLNVPQIHARDLQQGFLLLTDLGIRLYLQHLNETSVERMYGDALGALITLQMGIFTDGPGPTPAERVDNTGFLPDYDARLLRDEMELFRRWYLERHCGFTLTRAQHAVLDRVFDHLTQSALAQPRVWVHRDYHSRNLLVTGVNNPGILDFQDAVRGPVTYDLVSLLRDCYIRWPRERVQDWAKGYHALCQQSGIPVCDDEVQFLEWFDRMGVQRHLKAAGIFARLNHRDDKPGYLRDIPRTLGYVDEVTATYPELHPLHQLLQELNIPTDINGRGN